MSTGLPSRAWGRVTGAPSYRQLPDRVQSAIADQQDASERLISLVQFGVVATFGTLYFIAPKTGPAGAFAPAPWALAAYLVFTVTRAFGASLGRLPGWFLATSVITDMALLLVLIWSFHLQYAQPASFYLKVPTLLYVFIFIALRALRFEARYVALAGLAAIAGWSLLVAYAVFAEPGNMMITRNYVEYMTSNAILIGAEFDKIITIATVTLILVVALRRAQGLLVLRRTRRRRDYRRRSRGARRRRSRARSRDPVRRHPLVHFAGARDGARRGHGAARRLSVSGGADGPPARRCHR